MIRNVDMNEISDGRLYGKEDMVKTDCHGCHGCFQCCTEMGSSIILDPYDCYLLTRGLQRSFDSLLMKELELNIVDGMILPNIKMQPENHRCAFLNEQGRCQIHSFRPGICRMFPLGRMYRDNDFVYILQDKECPYEPKTKIKVKKWIQAEDEKQYDCFLLSWHCLVRKLRTMLASDIPDEKRKRICLEVLKNFYQIPYDNRSFFEQFEERMNIIKNNHE